MLFSWNYRFNCFRKGVSSSASDWALPVRKLVAYLGTDRPFGKKILIPLERNNKTMLLFSGHMLTCFRTRPLQETRAGRKNSFMKQCIAFFMGCLLSFTIHAQSFTWAQSFGLSGSQCSVNTIAVDDSNNIYSLGGFKNTVDFNSGPGVYNLTAIGTVNTFLLKEDANGNFVWVKQLKGLSSGVLGIWGDALAFDTSGNIYIAGNLKDSFDVDTGPNVHKISSPYNYDAYILKLNHNGDFLWVKQFGNNIQTVASSVGVTGMRLDVSNNIYLACSITGTNDVDPSNNVVSVTVPSIGDVLIEKLDSVGNFCWYKQISGTDVIEPFALEKDSQNNLYFVGAYKGTVDFDPSASNTVFATSTGGTDIFIEKIDSLGNYVWAKQIGESNYSDEGLGITLDKHNNVLVTGFFEGTVDFDPSLVVANLYAPSRNTFILKLNNTGNFVWAKSLYNFSSPNDGGISIVPDSNNNVYVTGNTSSSADFDPGVGTYYLNNQGSNDIFVEKLDSSGGFINALEFGTAGYDFGNTIRLDKFNNILLCGVIGAYGSPGSGDFDPGLGTFNMFGNNYGFIEKLCNSNPLQLNTNTTVFCEGDTAKLYTPPMGNTAFQWVKDGNVIPNFAGDTLKVYQSGNYSVGVAGNSCAQSTTFFMQALPIGHPTISIVAPATVPFGQQATVTANLTGITGAYLIHWFVNGQMFTTNNSATFGYSKAWGIDTVFASIVAQAPCNDTSISAIAYIMATEGIENIPSQNQFLIYPNPATNTLNIKTQQAGNLMLTDITGRVILQSSIINHLSQIDISSLAKGVYLLRLSSNDGAVETVKVVKE